MVFLGVSQHAESDFDIRFDRGDRHISHSAFMPLERRDRGVTQRDMDVTQRDTGVTQGTGASHNQPSVAYRL